MSVTVLIKNTKHLITIKKEWVENVNSESSVNFGILSKNYIPRKIFFSINEDDAPDFNRNIEENFNGEMVGCFYAYIYKYQSK